MILPKIHKVHRSRSDGHVIRLPIYSGGPPLRKRLGRALVMGFAGKEPNLLHRSHTLWAPSGLHQKTPSPQAPYPDAMSFISHRFFGSHASGRPSISWSRSCTPVVPTHSHIPMWIFPYLGAIAHTNPRLPHFPYSDAISHTNARSPIGPASSKKTRHQFR